MKTSTALCLYWIKSLLSETNQMVFRFLKLIVCITSFSTVCYGEVDKGIHEIWTSFDAKKCNGEGVETGNDITLSGNLRFIVERPKPDKTGYIIHFLHYPVSNDTDEKITVARATALLVTDKSRAKKLAEANARAAEKAAAIKYATDFNTQFYEGSPGNKVLFFITNEEYESFTILLQQRVTFTTGAAASLIKIRPRGKELLDGKYPIPFDFGNGLSLGGLLGAKINSIYASNPNSLSLLFGIGTASISLDSVTTRGYLNSSTYGSALYLSFGFVAEHNKFQIGLFTGLDILAGEVGRKWVYRDRPWIGLTLGYAIFTPSKPIKVSDQTEKR